MKCSFVFPMILFLTCVHVHAEVFSLWGGRSQTGREEEILKPEMLRSETIQVDGRNLEMKIGMLHMEFTEALRRLKNEYPNASFALNRGACLAEIRQKDGSRKRIYLLHIDGVYPVICFSMLLPPEQESAPKWPEDFPLPPGSTPVSVLRFPKRNAVYGMFRSDSQISSALTHVSSALKSAGWKAATEEHRAGFSGGTGEIFLKGDQMMILGFAPDKNGRGCTGTLYRKSIR